MAFDLNTARPVGGGGGFDLSTARPVSEGNPNASMVKNAAGGFLEGLTGIGNTLLAPLDAVGIPQALGGLSREERMKETQSFLNANSDPNSATRAITKIGTQIAGTAGVPGALAKFLGAGATAAGIGGISPKLLAAIESGGFNLGTPMARTAAEGLANAGYRLAGGAIAGGATAGLADPHEAGTGAVIGAALPGVVKTAGAMGSALKTALIDPLTNKEKIIGAVIDRVSKGAPQLQFRTPQTHGVTFSAGQSTGNAGLAAIEDTMRAINPNGALSVQAQANRDALANTMRNIAQDDTALAAAQAARERASTPLYTAARNSTAEVEANRVVDLIDTLAAKNPGNRALTGPLAEIKSTLQKSAGSPARQILVDRYGNVVNGIDIPQPPQMQNFLDQVKKAGGIDVSEIPDIGKDINNKIYPGLFRKGGMKMDRLTEWADQNGWLVNGQIDDLERNAVGGSHEYVRDMIRGGLAKEPVIHPTDYNLLAAHESDLQKLADEGFKVVNLAGKKAELRNGVGEVMSAMDNIDALLGKQENKFVRRELMTIKNALAHQINKVEPKFGEAERTFAQMSRPINQMQVGTRMADTLIPATAEAERSMGQTVNPVRLNAAAFNRSIRNADQTARLATGFRRAQFDKVMEPEQAQAIRGVGADVGRIAEASSLGAGVGSPTARRQAIQNMIGDYIATENPIASNVLAGLMHMPVIGTVPRGIASITRAGGSMLGKKVNETMARMLEDALANDPAALQNYLRAYLSPQPQNALTQFLARPEVGSVARSLPVLGAISANP